MNQIEKAIEDLNNTYPGIKAVDLCEWNGSPEGQGIWMRGSEDGITAADGLRLIDYYAENYDIWEMGVHKDLRSLLEKHGLFGEFNDPGTLMAYKA